MKRCFYDDPIPVFLGRKNEEILGMLSKDNSFDLTLEQRDAWVEEIEVMKEALQRINLAGHIIFEYTIPRLGKRVDVVLLMQGMVLCLEFKSYEGFTANNKEQVWDYALDLKNFHEESSRLTIVPILIAHETISDDNALHFCQYDDNVYYPLFANPESLTSLLSEVLSKENGNTNHINPHDWIYSRYAPTPTIIQAASALYMNHSVEDITKHEADKAGIDTCTQFILDVIKESKEKKQKSICFVTGVPGAGKTLAHERHKGDTH